MAERLWSADQIRRWETYLFQQKEASSLLIMEEAARAVQRCIADDFPQKASVVVLCGKGDNGGDGLSLARQLFLQQFDVQIVLLAEINSLKKNAQTMAITAKAMGVPISICPCLAELQDCLRDSLAPFDAIVDAILGIGINREPDELSAFAIHWANEQKCARKYAIDMPSGLDSSGKRWQPCFRADRTVTFFGAKIGQLFYPGKQDCGTLTVAPLARNQEEVNVFFSQDKTFPLYWKQEDVAAWLRPRPADSHKGMNGSGLIVGGTAGMSGAARLSSQAALRSGIGRLRLAVPEPCATAIWASLPECMCYGLSASESGGFSQNAIEQLIDLCDKQTAVAAGPGWGHGEAVWPMLSTLLEMKLPLIIDADGLNSLSDGHLLDLKNAHADVLLTPHPGEMARLCQKSVPEIVENPISAARNLSEETGATVLLKGATSVCASPDGRVAVNTTGGPSLAKGGSGDMLTGIALALLCQGLPLFEAGISASFLLGRSADLLNMDERGVFATDVIQTIPEAIASCRISEQKEN